MSEVPGVPVFAREELLLLAPAPHLVADEDIRGAIDPVVLRAGDHAVLGERDRVAEVIIVIAVARPELLDLAPRAHLVALKHVDRALVLVDRVCGCRSNHESIAAHSDRITEQIGHDRIAGDELGLGEDQRIDDEGIDRVRVVDDKRDLASVNTHARRDGLAASVLDGELVVAETGVAAGTLEPDRAVVADARREVAGDGELDDGPAAAVSAAARRSVEGEALLDAERTVDVPLGQAIAGARLASVLNAIAVGDRA